MPTITTKPITRSNVAIKCFVNPNVANSGLENYNMSLHNGAEQSEDLFLRQVSEGVFKAVNGLDETAPEILKLPEEERKAAIKDIRETVSLVHYMLFGGDKVDIKDKDFWSKCAELSPTNIKFWGNNDTFPQGFKIALNDSGRFLDMSNPMDILIERAIKAGGYKALIASSIEDAYNWPYPTPPKFYLDRLENTAALQTELRKIVNKAKRELDTLKDENLDKLLIVARNFDPDPTQYKKSTPADVVYLNMDKGIDGELWEKNKRAAAQRFLDLCKMSNEDLSIRAIVKCATKYRYLDYRMEDKENRTGNIYYMDEGIPVGRTVEEAVMFLKNPINSDILNKLKNKVDAELNN